jgi:hypothetical protein
MFQWLGAHRFINALLVAVYSFFLVFAHPWFVDRSVEMMNRLSIPAYDRVVAIVVGIAVISFSSAFLMVIYQGTWKTDKKLPGYFLGTLLLLAAHFFVLTEMNIEFIHALMYGILAVLIFPLVGRFGGAVVLGLPLMLFDEWYQHVILFPHYTFFFEFNDIILDLLGAGLFVSLLGLFGIRSEQIFRPLHKRSEVWLLLALAVAIIGIMTTCLIVPYSEDACQNTWFILNKLPEMSGFWYVHPVIGSTFHILKPMEGMVLMFLMSIAYLGMDTIRPTK